MTKKEKKEEKKRKKNFSKIALVLLSASVERLGVSHTQDFILF